MERAGPTWAFARASAARAAARAWTPEPQAGGSGGGSGIPGGEHELAKTTTPDVHGGQNVFYPCLTPHSFQFLRRSPLSRNCIVVTIARL